MQNEQKRELIQLLNNYVDSHAKLSALMEDENRLTFTENYPFEQSFDDLLLSVMTWRDTQVEIIQNSMKGTPLEELEKFEKHADGSFKKWLAWIKKSRILQDVTELYMHYSGGGHEHFMMRLKDGRIITIHLVDEFIDLSGLKWESIEAYIIDEDDKGLGFEQEHPDANKRCLNMTLKNFTKIIDLYKKTI